MADNTPQNTIQNGLLILLKSRPKMLLGLLVFVLLSSLAMMSVFRHLQARDQQQAVDLASQNVAKSQSSKVDEFLKAQQQQLGTVTASLQSTTVLEHQAQKSLPKLETQLLQQAPTLKSLQLFVPDDPRLDSTSNFVVRELALRTLSGELPSAEATRVDANWDVLFVQPVLTEDSQIIAALVASAPAKDLQQLLAADAGTGQTRIYQRFPGLEKSTFATLGTKLPDQASFTAKTALPVWQVEFVPNQRMLDLHKPSLGDLALPLVGLITLELLLIALFVKIAYQVIKNAPLKTVKNEAKETDQASEDDDDEERTAAKSYLQIIPTSVDIDATPAASDEKSKAADTHSATIEEYPATVFRDYDIRGIYGAQINASFAHQLGRCLGTKAKVAGENTLVVGRDGRLSSDELAEALQAGILETGCNVINIGRAPTPILSFALHHLDETSSGVMVTASHNPAGDNGFKIFIKEHALCGDEITALRENLKTGNFTEGSGTLQDIDLLNDYATTIIDDILPAMGLKVVVDAGNGVAGESALAVLGGIGCDVIPLYCDVDGNFPNHPPDTAVAENLTDLIGAVKAMEADLGIGLDGDGDRIVAVTASGRIVWPDELMMIFAKDVVSRQPGSDIVFDVKSTRRLNKLISSYGGRPVMCKTGHSHMRNKIIECNAPLGGEYSGHIFFHDRWHGFDDATYAAARLIEIMTLREQSLDDIVSSFEVRHSTAEIKIAVDDEEKFGVMDALMKEDRFPGAQINTLDGIRAEYPKAWGLVRASNTSPALTLRFEADTSEQLEKIQSLFRTQLSSIDSSLTF